MSNPTYPLKSYMIGRFTIIFRNGQWVVLEGSVQKAAFSNEPEAKRWASSN